jgi:hypothetical protein
MDEPLLQKSEVAPTGPGGALDRAAREQLAASADV